MYLVDEQARIPFSPEAIFDKEGHFKILTGAPKYHYHSVLNGQKLSNLFNSMNHLINVYPLLVRTLGMY